MPDKKIKLPIGASIVILFSLILLSLQLMSSATQESSQLNAMYSWLLLVNILGSVVLLGLVVVNIYSLYRQLKKRQAGSRLTTRMILLFVLLSLAPAAIVFYFSAQFLHQGIDSWFNVEIDRAMEDALELSQASLDQRMRWHLKQVQQMSGELSNKSSALAAIELEKLRVAAGASEMALLSRSARIIASSSVNPSEILPSLPVDYVWLQLQGGNDYVGLDIDEDDRLLIQVVTQVEGKHKRYLQALFPVPVRIADLADSVEFAFVRYQEMTFLRD